MRGAGGMLAAAAFGAVVGCSFGSTEPGAGEGDGDGDTSAAESTGLPSTTSGSPPTGTGGGDASSGELPVDGSGTTSADSSPGTTTEGDSTSSTGGDESSTGGDDVEICDGKDNDGDGGIDEGSPRNPMCNGCQFVLSTDTLTYFAICPDELAWEQAREACKVFGPSSDLATIDNADDNDLLIGMTAEDHFVGLSDLDQEGEWVWIDGIVSITGGVKQDYDGWSSTQPSGGVAQNCGELDPNQNGWADAGCNSTQRYICEHPA